MKIMVAYQQRQRAVGMAKAYPASANITGEISEKRKHQWHGEKYLQRWRQYKQYSKIIKISKAKSAKAAKWQYQRNQPMAGGQRRNNGGARRAGVNGGA
jgi:hypothetical protein